MNKIISFIVFLLISNGISLSQTMSFFMAIEDSKGLKDTVIFGFSANASLAIDPALGEENIYDKSFDSLEIRVIQRDSTHHNCLMKRFINEPIYSPYLIDSKIDYRENVMGGTINFDFGSVVYLYDNECILLDSYDPIPSPEFNEMFVIDSISKHTLTINFVHEVGINNIKKSQYNIGPNPVNHTLYIKNNNNGTGKQITISVYNIIGMPLYEKRNIDGNSDFLINVDFLQNGFYILHIKDSNNDEFVTKTFTKI